MLNEILFKKIKINKYFYLLKLQVLLNNAKLSNDVYSTIVIQSKIINYYNHFLDDNNKRNRSKIRRKSIELFNLKLKSYEIR